MKIVNKLVFVGVLSIAILANAAAPSSLLAPFDAKEDENVHDIATRMKAANAHGQLIEAIVMINGADARDVLEDRGISKDKYEAFAVETLTNCLAAIDPNRALYDEGNRRRLLGILKEFWNNGHAAMETDPETGIDPAMIMMNTVCVLNNNIADEKTFSLVVHALQDAANPETGGQCLQGYTVRLTVALLEHFRQMGREASQNAEAQRARELGIPERFAGRIDEIIERLRGLGMTIEDFLITDIGFGQLLSNESPSRRPTSVSLAPVRGEEEDEELVIDPDPDDEEVSFE
ncbi:MAG: hypothetical protein LBI30_03325 [Holosporales bacterium]|jgi:hypothetical protein|nr:hypothetical protein [Holosporales bacterium]